MKRLISVFLALALAAGFATVCSASEDVSGRIKDPAFLAAVYDELGMDPGDMLTKADCESLEFLSLTDLGIKNLQGIELFTNLTNLWVDENELYALDVTQNRKLEYLNCGYNYLKSLDVTQNKELDCLQCEGNQLTALNVTKNTKLRSLDCSFNKIQSLNLRHNPELLYLYCMDNSWNLLDISKNPKLEELNNQLNGAVYGRDFSEDFAYSGAVSTWMQYPVWAQWILRYLCLGWLWMGYIYF